jgi:hypothetical protein
LVSELLRGFSRFEKTGVSIENSVMN